MCMCVYTQLTTSETFQMPKKTSQSPPADIVGLFFSFSSSFFFPRFSFWKIFYLPIYSQSIFFFFGLLKMFLLSCKTRRQFKVFFSLGDRSFFVCLCNTFTFLSCLFFFTTQNEIRVSNNFPLTLLLKKSLCFSRARRAPCQDPQKK